ncbi:hypothetical protein CK203_012864 [Vitis vinifera]|uniref:F-box domain-containing protein n=1 Tax=Vitis vinifera TaxID=29760 RepID=A0A438JM97_VITVI|nr:hypothetical protein CK203_012864 [Vitis vinifera]
MRTRLMALPSSSDWPSLPINLLDSILDYLVPMEDYLTFSEVCIEWHYAVRGKLQHLRSNHKRHRRLHQQVPLLMAPLAGRSMSNPSDGSVYVFVFSLNDRTVTPLYPYSRQPLLWISPKFV